MTATQQRTYTAYQDGENAQPIVDVVINPLPSANGIVGWSYRDQDDPSLFDTIQTGDACRWRIRVPAGLTCNEDGSYLGYDEDKAGF